MIDLLERIFSLSPAVKKALIESYQKMPADKQKQFILFLNEMLKKEEKILNYVSKNDHDFNSNLKIFLNSQKMKAVKNIENKSTKSEQEELDILTDQLNKI